MKAGVMKAAIENDLSKKVFCCHSATALSCLAACGASIQWFSWIYVQL